MARSVLLFVLALLVALCSGVSVRSQYLSKGKDASRAVRRSEADRESSSTSQWDGDVLLSKKKKKAKKGAAAEDGEAPVDGALGDGAGKPAAAAAQGAATGGSSAQSNSTVPAAPTGLDGTIKGILDKVAADKKAEEERKKIEDAKPKVT